MASTRTSQTAGEAQNTDGAPSGDVTPVIAVNGETANVEVASTPDPDRADVPKMADLTGIKYRGMADRKILQVSDLQAMGVENPKGDLVWSAENGFTVGTEEFNAATRDVLLTNKDFVVA